MSSKPKVYFFFKTEVSSLRNRNSLKNYIIGVFKKEAKTLETLNFIFCSDSELLQMNKEYLKHDYYTDIITFNLADDALPIVAEVYISFDRVKDNAHQQNVSIKSELHRVIFHGILHLCGYKDKTRDEKKAMRIKEDYYLNRYL